MKKNAVKPKHGAILETLSSTGDMRLLFLFVSSLGNLGVN